MGEQKVTDVGIVGAGTMGSGIALACLYADLAVALVDVVPESLGRARSYLETYLKRKDKLDRLQNLTLSNSFDALGGVDVVIEAVPEDPSLKQQVFTKLGQLCPPPTPLATNTSTLSVTEIAAAAEAPERVAGMHFFNPAPVLPLVEIVRAAQTSEAVMDELIGLARRLGKEAVVVSDQPGFIVNRVARPFYGEALRLLAEGVADHETLDGILELGGGFPMGAFRLMDLIGIDVNFAAMKSMYERTFGEPRYQPHVLQQRKIQQGTMGRKTGRGFYRYQDEAPVTTQAEPPDPVRAEGQLSVSPGSWAPGLRRACVQAGYQHSPSARGKSSLGIVVAGRGEGLKEHLQAMDQELPAQLPLLCQCADVAFSELATWTRQPERLIGFDGLFFAAGRAASLVSGPSTQPAAKQRVEQFVRSLGKLPIWLGEGPGLVLPRVVCSLVNEAAFAVNEGVAAAEDIDRAMRLGVNYPRGPLSWGEQLGWAKVIQVLDHLFDETREPRYRASPLLRRWARRASLDGVEPGGT